MAKDMRVPGLDFFSLRSAGAKWHLHQVRPDQGRLRYVKMQPSDYVDSVFLDTRIQRQSDEAANVPVPRAASASSCGLPVHFIFHNSFCGSTLLSRAFESDPSTLVLREPLALLQLAETRRLHGQRWRGRRFKRLLDTVVAGLSHGFAHQKRVIIKPSNLVNGLYPLLLGCAAFPSIWMFQDLRSFLVSCAKKNAETQLRILNLPEKLCGYYDLTISQEDQWWIDQARGDYLRAGALAWLIQLRYLAGAMDSPLGQHLIPVDFNVFLKSPMLNAQRLAAMLSIRPGHSHWIGTHAKAPDNSYGVQRRETESKRVEQLLGRALPDAMVWLDRAYPDQADALYSTLYRASERLLDRRTPIAV